MNSQPYPKPFNFKTWFYLNISHQLRFSYITKEQHDQFNFILTYSQEKLIMPELEPKASKYFSLDDKFNEFVPFILTLIYREHDHIFLCQRHLLKLHRGFNTRALIRLFIRYQKYSMPLIIINFNQLVYLSLFLFLLPLLLSFISLLTMSPPFFYVHFIGCLISDWSFQDSHIFFVTLPSFIFIWIFKLMLNIGVSYSCQF